MPPQKARRANVEFARFEMRSRKNPSSAAAKATIRRTQGAIEIAVQSAPLRTAAEAHGLVGNAASGQSLQSVFSTLSASARRSVALWLRAGTCVFLSAQTRSLFTQDENPVYCIHCENHLVPSDTKVSYPLNPDPLLGGVKGSPKPLARDLLSICSPTSLSFTMPIPFRVRAKRASGSHYAGS